MLSAPDPSRGPSEQMVYILRSSSGFFVLGSNPGPVLSGQPCSMAVKFLKRKFLHNLSPRVDDHIDKMEEDLRELNDEAEIVKENIKFLMTKKVKTLGKIEKLKVKGDSKDSKDIMENLFNRSCGKKISMGELHQSGSNLEVIASHYKEIEHRDNSISECEEDLVILQEEIEDYWNMIVYGEEASDLLSDGKFPIVPHSSVEDNWMTRIGFEM